MFVICKTKLTISTNCVFQFIVEFWSLVKMSCIAKKTRKCIYVNRICCFRLGFVISIFVKSMHHQELLGIPE